MVIVTGTKRSGTSMWMQMLVAAGLPHIGERFPGPWEKSIGHANPGGFYESRLRQGVFYATNPDRRTGEYLPPAPTRQHAVKIFIPGLVRTDIAYVHRVVATMRHWSSYGPSLRRLQDMEDEYFFENPKEGMTGEEMVANMRKRRSKIPGPIEWFLEYYDLVRDLSTRRYALNLSTYESLLEDPQPILERVFAWLGIGEPAKALEIIDTTRNPWKPQPWDTEGVSDTYIQLFNDVHDSIHRTQSLPPTLLARMNEAQAELVKEYGRLNADRLRDES